MKSSVVTAKIILIFVELLGLQINEQIRKVKEMTHERWLKPIGEPKNLLKKKQTKWAKIGKAETHSNSNRKVEKSSNGK